MYFPHTEAVPENVAVKVLNRTHSITAEVEIPAGGAEGVLLSHGGNAGGNAFFVTDRKLHYVHNDVGVEEYHVESRAEVPDGPCALRFEFDPTGAPDIARGKGAPGRAQLYIDGQLAGQADLPVTVPLLMALGGGLVCGRHPGSPVSRLYRPPFAFTGRIVKVTIDVSGRMIQDTEEEMKAFARAQMARP